MPAHITRLISSLSQHTIPEAKLHRHSFGNLFYIRTDMKVDEKNKDKQGKTGEPGFIERLTAKVTDWVRYAVTGVWNDPRRTAKVRVVKIGNLAVRSFFDRDLQLRSMSLTYSTVLSIVPAFALLVAIGRGFGLSDLLQEQLYNFFPSQHQVISTGLQFVDSYLSSATQGLFVGVGIVVLLWTISSLLSYIEDAFNTIWHVKQQRSFFQKITDYIAICLIIPILMICSSGVSIFMSTVIQDNIHLPFLTPMINNLLELVPLVLTWLAFTLSYFLIPNTKVQFKYAAISGTIIAIGFLVLQELFLSGQIYVSKYNAIYGSFAFLPLLLVWLQLSWLMLLAGCVLTFSMQNVYTFNLMGDADKISINSWHRVALIEMSVVAQRFVNREPPLSHTEIAVRYNLPVRIVERVTEILIASRLVYEVKREDDEPGLSPAVEIRDLTAGEFLKTFDAYGEMDFIPDMDDLFSGMLDEIVPLEEKAYAEFNTLHIVSLPLPTPEEIETKTDILAENMIKDSEKRK